MNKEKINLPLNPNSKSANIKKIDLKTNENINNQMKDERKHISMEKINGDPNLNNLTNSLNIQSNEKFKEMKKRFINLLENGQNRYKTK